MGEAPFYYLYYKLLLFFKNKTGNYKSVSFLSAPAKLIEKLIKDRVTTTLR